jgi:hypothetical protein
MIKAFRFLAIFTISVAFATLSMAWAVSYTQIDYPGAIATTLNGGPNPQGTSVGSWTDSGGVIHGFTLTAHGVFKSFDPPGSTLTIPNFISPQGDVVGLYVDGSGVSHGFILSGGNYTTVDYPGAPGSALTGLNPSGELSGYFCSDPACGLTGNASSDVEHSFVLSKKGGIFTTFDPPGATGSVASTVNPSGAVVGAYDTTAEGTCFNFCEGYLLYHGTFVTINFPGGTYTFAGGNNAPGDIVGLWFDTSGVGHSFLLSNGVYTSFDPPGAVFSDAAGINPGGVIVGIFFDSSGSEHGYVRTP